MSLLRLNRRGIVLHGRRHFSYAQSIEGLWTALSRSTPVALLQDGIVQLHDTTGLPWWATVIVSTVALRTAITLPLAVYQNRNMAKFEKVATIDLPEISKQLKQETAIAVRKFNWTEDEARRAFTASVSPAAGHAIVQLINWSIFSVARPVFEAHCQGELPSRQVHGHSPRTDTALGHSVGCHPEPFKPTAQS